MLRVALLPRHPQVTKTRTLEANPVPSGARVLTVHGEVSLAALVARNLVAHDDQDPKADDVACVAFARAHGCAYVTNDGFA